MTVALRGSRQSLPNFPKPGSKLSLLCALALLAFANLAGAQSTPAPHLSLASVLTPTANGGLTPDALVQTQAALFAAQTQFDNISLRLAALRSGGRGSRAGLAFAPGNQGGPLSLMWQSSLADEAKPEEVGTDFSRWGFFASAGFGDGSTDPGLVNPGSNFRLSSFTAGADYRHSDSWLFGAAIGLDRQKTDLDGGLGRVDSTGWNVSGYSTYYTKDSWYADTVASYGHNSFDMRLEVGSQVITGNPDGKSVSAAASFGRDFNHGAWGFGPYARLQYTHLSFDPFTERVAGTGPIAPQEINPHSLTSLSSVLGGKLNYVHSTSWGVVIPHMDAEWQHEFRGDPAVIEANFAGGSPTVFVGDPVDQNFFKVGLGMSFVMTHGRSGFFYYDRLFGAERLSKSNIGVGIRIEF